LIECIRAVGRAVGLAVGAVLLTAGLPDHLTAQAVLEQFSYDELRPSGIQVDVGLLGASQLQGAVVGGVRLDYGFVAPKVRVLLGLSYFRSQLDRDTRARFEQRIRNLVIDPSGDDTIQVGRIFWSDLAADLDLQYTIPQGRRVVTYIGAGLGVHLRNGSGTAIDGTFVEDALDDITAGANATIGVEIELAPAWRFTLDGRGVISTGLSSVSLRAGMMYRLPAGRRLTTAP
jgi:hypothetical protein